MAYRRIILVLICLATPTAVPSAHHPVSDVYDQTETLTLAGEIVALVYRNPHTILHVDVSDRSGARRTWAIEWSSATRLLSRGVTLDTLQPGDRVVACGNPGRDPGQYRLLLLTLTRPADGWTSDPHRCEGV